jgi:hypothetical protein
MLPTAKKVAETALSSLRRYAPSACAVAVSGASTPLALGEPAQCQRPRYRGAGDHAPADATGQGQTLRDRDPARA